MDELKIGGLTDEQIVESFCSDCWLYTDKDPHNIQEELDCPNCYNALKEGPPNMRILRRYSKDPDFKSNEITVWDWIRRPKRKFGEHGVKRVDYAVYLKLRGKIKR